MIASVDLLALPIRVVLAEPLVRLSTRVPPPKKGGQSAQLQIGVTRERSVLEPVQLGGTCVPVLIIFFKYSYLVRLSQ